jgi:hypothetical protein
METNMKLSSKTGLSFFGKIALKTCAEPISNLSAQCYTIPMICGSHPHITNFLNHLHPTRCARIHSTHVSLA